MTTDSVEMQDIRGLEIDKTVKGFADIEYIFKKDCLVNSTSSDAIRWYTKDSSHDALAPIPPQQTTNVSPLSEFPILELKWKRNTSYTRKYAVKGFFSMEDIKTSDIDVLTQSIRDLTLHIVKQVDTRIYEILDASGNQTFATTAIGGDQWDAASAAGDPVKDLLHAKSLVEQKGYDGNRLVCYLHPVDARNLLSWLIGGKGSSIPSFASEKVRTGTLMNLLGITIKVSPNATQDQAILLIPQRSCTWKSVWNTTSAIIDHPGMGKEIRIWEEGEAIRTDPNSVVKITDLQT